MFQAEGWEKTKERMQALWAGKTPDRCIISVPVVKNWDWVAGYYQKPQDKQGRLAYHYDPEQVYARNCLRRDNLYFGGDCLPLIWPDFGTAGHAKYYKGAKWEIGPDTIWFDPILSEPDPNLLEYTPKITGFRWNWEL